MPPEAPRRFQFTLRKALLALAILSPCMIALSATVRAPENLLIALVLITATSLVAAFIVVLVIGIHRLFGPGSLPRLESYGSRDASVNQPDSIAEHRRKPLHPAFLTMAAFLFAGFAQLIELFMTGMGHGWASPIKTSPWNYLFALLIGILVFVRRRARNKSTSEATTTRVWYYVLVLACGLVLAAKDIGIVTLTNEEGWYYAQRTFEALFPLVIVWLAVLGGAHLLVLWALFAPIAQAQRDRPLE